MRGLQTNGTTPSELIAGLIVDAHHRHDRRLHHRLYGCNALRLLSVSTLHRHRRHHPRRLFYKEETPLVGIKTLVRMMQTVFMAMRQLAGGLMTALKMSTVAPSVIIKVMVTTFACGATAVAIIPIGTLWLTTMARQHVFTMTILI
jgi:hypothetical protein